MCRVTSMLQQASKTPTGKIRKVALRQAVSPSTFDARRQCHPEAMTLRHATSVHDPTTCGSTMTLAPTPICRYTGWYSAAGFFSNSELAPLRKAINRTRHCGRLATFTMQREDAAD